MFEETLLLSPRGEIEAIRMKRIERALLKREEKDLRMKGIFKTDCFDNKYSETWREMIAITNVETTEDAIGHMTTMMVASSILQLTLSERGKRSQIRFCGSVDAVNRPKGRPEFEGTLKTFKQYASLHDSIQNPTELGNPEMVIVAESNLEQKYRAYKKEFRKHQNRTFFDQHKGDEWLKEKYEPTVLEAKRIEKHRSISSL